MAAKEGIDGRTLRSLVDQQVLTHVITGVYAEASLTIDLDRKIEAISLVLPPGGVVVDRTAAWLHGLDVLRRSSIYEVPPVEIYVSGGTRMRREGAESGCRQLSPADVVEINGVPVTTPLRTSIDLARLLWRYDALGAVDQYLRFGVPREAMMAELPRFRGFRWVTQARKLVALGDARAESMPESALRLHWHETLSVLPEPQVWVRDADGHDVFRVDVAARKMRYGAEYDGEEHHTSTEDAAHDERRRSWLDGRGWEIDSLTSGSIYGFSPHPSEVLLSGWDRARARHGLCKP